MSARKTRTCECGAKMKKRPLPDRYGSPESFITYNATWLMLLQCPKCKNVEWRVDDHRD